MKVRHNISDFVFRHDLPCEPHVYDAILHYHLIPIQKVENQLDCKVVPTLVGSRGGGGSVYRHPRHEREQGRSETGEHTFKDKKGAGDYSVTDFKQFHRFGELLTRQDFTRFFFYHENHFVHVDYRNVEYRQFFVFDGAWKLVEREQFLQKIKNNY